MSQCLEYTVRRNATYHFNNIFSLVLFDLQVIVDGLHTPLWKAVIACSGPNKLKRCKCTAMYVLKHSVMQLLNESNSYKPLTRRCFKNQSYNKLQEIKVHLS